jgi:hypothetical protein
MFRWWKSRQDSTSGVSSEARIEFRSPGFAVRLKRRFRELVEVIYTDDASEFVFQGELVGAKWQQINISPPKMMLEENLQRVLPRLTTALTELRHEFVIFRVSGAQIVPKAEKAAATAKLRKIGFETEIAAEGSALKLRKSNNWKPVSGERAKQQALEISPLINPARGRCQQVEILAKSESADVNFL